MELFKLTTKAKQALSIAKKEAQLLKNKYAGTEHLLLGLLNIGDSVITDILEDLGVDIAELRDIIYDNISQEGDDPIPIDDIAYTPRVDSVIDLANTCAHKLEREKIDIEHIFLGLLYENDGVANNILNSLGVDYSSVKGIINKELGGPLDTEVGTSSFDIEDSEMLRLKNLQKFGTDLTRLAAKRKIDPIIGRDKEINRLIQILCRKTKNNPVLVGDAGVGKTAVVEGLAQRIVDGRVPNILTNKHIFSLDISAVVAGTKYRGQFEERILAVINEVKKSKNVIVFLDEIHMIVGAGSAEGAMDASNILKPALARGELRCIGATTPDEFRKSIESDSALERRFQPIKVGEPSLAETLQILQGIKSTYEKFHNVTYTDESLEAAVKLSRRYITDRRLPDKAIDIMDEAGATNHAIDEYTQRIQVLREKVKLAKSKKESLIKGQQFEEACKFRDKEKELADEYEELVEKRNSNKKQITVIDKKTIEKIVSCMTGVPVSFDETVSINKVLSLEADLTKFVVGQVDAIKCVADSLKRSAAKINDPKRPIGSFLFLGPSGVGKTYLAKILAQEIFDDEDNIIQIDMSELMDQHSSAKLLGSPPGYIGHDKGGKLTEAVRRNPYIIILFDEIEKADSEVLNTLLQILEEGRLTDGLGREVNFKHTIVIMTTNVGAKKIQDPVPIGFVSPDDDEKQEMRNAGVLEEVRSAFKPEFINRVDEIVTFNSLRKDDISKIIDLNFNEYVERIKEEHEVTIQLDKTARSLFLEKGFDEKYGARELRRTIQQLFETEIATYLLRSKYKPGDTVVCYARESKLKFRKKTIRKKH